jgi:hypothetical protein
MDTVKLKSKYGSTHFRRRTMRSNERGDQWYEMKDFEFNFDNDFKCDVPKSVWEDLESLPFDRTFNLLYRDAFQIL